MSDSVRPHRRQNPLGFSRPDHWSGLPLPSLQHVLGQVWAGWALWTGDGSRSQGIWASFPSPPNKRHSIPISHQRQVEGSRNYWRTTDCSNGRLDNQRTHWGAVMRSLRKGKEEPPESTRALFQVALVGVWGRTSDLVRSLTESLGRSFSSIDSTCALTWLQGQEGHPCRLHKGSNETRPREIL